MADTSLREALDHWHGVADRCCWAILKIAEFAVPGLAGQDKFRGRLIDVLRRRGADVLKGVLALQGVTKDVYVAFTKASPSVLKVCGETAPNAHQLVFRLGCTVLNTFTAATGPEYPSKEIALKALTEGGVFVPEAITPETVGLVVEALNDFLDRLAVEELRGWLDREYVVAIEGLPSDDPFAPVSADDIARMTGRPVRSVQNRLRAFREGNDDGW